MCNIRKNIEDEYIYSNNYLNKDEKIQIIKLYQSVLKKVENNNMVLRIYNETIDGNTYGETSNSSEFNKDINIKLDFSAIERSNNYSFDKIAKMKIAVIIHELGEVDYIVSKLPTITHDEWNYNGNIINYDLRVLISHYHINKLIEKFKLHCFVNEHLQCRKSVQNSLKEWEKIIEICWILVTYPSLGYNVNNLEIQIEENILKRIEEIIGIIRNIDTLNQSFNNIKYIEEKFNEIIYILNSFGMKKYIEEYDYRYKVKVVSRINI